MRILPTPKDKKGHYSPGVIMNGMLYISGQLPLVPQTGNIAIGGVRVQMRQALDNVVQVLLMADAAKENVGLCRIYLSDMSLWDDVNEVYAAFFGAHKPARVVVPTRELHYGALVEIEAVAELPTAAGRKTS